MFWTPAGIATSCGQVLICHEQACIMPRVVSGKQVALTFSLSWSQLWASGHKVGQLAFFGGISSQVTLLVSENKPQILLKSLHMCICAMQSF